MANLPFVVSMTICITLLCVVLVTFWTLIPKDSAQNAKLLGIIGVFSFAAAITAYGLAMFHFSQNPSGLIHFLLAVTMLVLLPAALLSTSVSAVTISNLRETIAAG